MNWDAYNLPAIWSMLRHESTCDGVDRVLDWDSLTHEIRTQHRKLKDVQAELAAAWPPEQNESARAFLDRIDILTASMDQTLRRAEDTRAGLRGIIEAIAEAQQTIHPLVDERHQVSDDLIPRWADHAEDEYDAKARAAMHKAEAAIADYATQIQAPPLYRTDTNDEEGGSAIPVTDPQRARPIPVPVPHDPPAADAARSGGPELAGVAAQPAPALTPPSGATAPSAISSASGAGFVPLSPLLAPPPFSGPSAAAGRQAVPVRSALPSGAVIGTPGAGSTPRVGASSPGTFSPGASSRGAVSPGASSRGASRGASSGGAFSPGAGSAPASSAAKPGAGPNAASRPQPPHAPHRDRKSAAEAPAIDGTPDRTWEVGEGVAPVIRPRRRGHQHTPGPGVIGIDR
ncbi:hypothetical protein [Actinoplanes sp. N902-109]|uniref:hypothetical protein n=1 Tax=Actinoplanes sp. (strain N902-109) TaxID=649831 RepID=UPI0003296603|nr:hypothetical protein [Actinoplanes sp. N902-109]AGL15220.1 hypothetical protein L083_1710 [Actinoplanes sp. N902-109]